MLFSKSKFSQVKSKPWNHHLYIFYSSNIWMSGTCFWNPYYRIFYSLFFFPSTQVLRLICNNPLFIVLCNTFQFLLDKIPCKYTLICISLTGLSPFRLVMEIWIAIISVLFSSWYSQRESSHTFTSEASIHNLCLHLSSKVSAFFKTDKIWNLLRESSQEWRFSLETIPWFDCFNITLLSLYIFLYHPLT